MIQVAKEEALQYVLEDVNGVAKPVITAAFWGTWKRMFSTQSLADILSNGGILSIRNFFPLILLWTSGVNTMILRNVLFLWEN